MSFFGCVHSRPFSRSIDLVSAKGKTKEVYCCDIVVLIVLFDVSDA